MERILFVFLVTLFTCFIHISRGDNNNNQDSNNGVKPSPVDFWLNPVETNPKPGSNYLYECQISTKKQQLSIAIDIFQCLEETKLNKILEKLKKFVGNVQDGLKYKSVTYDIMTSQTGCHCNVHGEPKNPVVDCQSLPPPALLLSADVHLNSESVTNSQVPDYIIAICGTDVDCGKADSKYGNIPYPQYFKFDTRRYQPVYNNEIFSTIDLYNSLYCKSVNSIALPWVESSKDQNLKCSCVCKAGYTLDISGTGDINKKCVPIPVPKLCDNIQKCYTFPQRSYQEGTCIVGSNDVFKDTSISQIRPTDNYVELTNNLYDTTDRLTPRNPGEPHIEFSIKNEKADGTINEVANLYFDWKEFTRIRDKLFQSTVFKSIGKHTIHIKAYDYSLIPAECEFVVFIKDEFHPTSKESCPGPSGRSYTFVPPTNFPDSISSDSVSNSASNDQGGVLTSYKKALTDYKTWMNSIRNDACGDDDLCNDKQFTRELSTLNGEHKVYSIDDIEKCFDIDQQYADNLIAETNKLDIVTIPCNYNSNNCKICCNLNYVAGEKTQAYSCNTQQWDTNKICEKGSSCSYNSCVDSSSKSFFKVKINIKKDIKKNSKSVIDNFPKQNNYNPVTQIHVINNCEKTLIESCYYKNSISGLFDVDELFRKNWQSTFGPLGYSAKEYIKIRYTVGGSGWKDYDTEKDTIIVFSELVTKIAFEAYSVCGTVLQATTFKVFQHPHNAPSICERFEDQGIYQASTGKTVNEAGPICNYPNTNYAEFTIEFDHTIPNIKSQDELVGYESFGGIQCTFSYRKSDGSDSDTTMILPSTNAAVLKHYAINLIDKPTTQKYTFVKITCDISYVGHQGYQLKDTCIKEFSIQDCDQPRIALSDSSCALDCVDQPKPKEACKGNIIHIGSNPPTFWSDTNNEMTCCSSCGTAKCVPIFDKDLLISQCEPAQISYASYSILQSNLIKLPKRLMSEYGMIAFMTVGIALSGIIAVIGVATARVYHRVREPELTCVEDGYNPLL